MSIFSDTEQEKQQKKLDKVLRQKYYESFVPETQLKDVTKRLEYSKWAPFLASASIGGLIGGLSGYVGANPLEKCQGTHLGAITGGGIGLIAAASLALAGRISGNKSKFDSAQLRQKLLPMKPNEYIFKPFTTTKIRTQLNQDYENWQKEQGMNNELSKTL